MIYVFFLLLSVHLGGLPPPPYQKAGYATVDRRLDEISKSPGLWYQMQQINLMTKRGPHDPYLTQTWYHVADWICSLMCRIICFFVLFSLSFRWFRSKRSWGVHPWDLSLSHCRSDTGGECNWSSKLYNVALWMHRIVLTLYLRSIPVVNFQLTIKCHG